ncbi:MAG: phage portal protein [Colwellia sp.]|nr:phage portal protein [Colwellia sp.]
MRFTKWWKTDNKEIIVDAKIKASDGSTIITVDDLARKFGTSNEILALKIEAVFACLRDKSESIGQIPIKMYMIEGNNPRVEIKKGRNYRIFAKKPNHYMNIQQFIELLVVSLERYGAFYAYVDRNDRGTIMSIIPFRHQANIVPNMDINGNVYYTYMKNNGTQGDPYNIDELFIIKGFTLDGFTPLSPIVQTATNLNIASAQDTSYEALQTKGITSQMALATDEVFSDVNARQRLKDDWKQFRGSKGVEQIPILEQGLKPVSLKLTPLETELLKQREFTVNRICRTFRVPLHRVGVVATTTKDNIFQLDEAYMRDALNPILVKIETELSRLMPEGSSVQFDRNAFYSGSPWRLMEHVERGVKGGLLQINEGRVMLGLEPVEGGDVFAIDNNNVVYGFWKDLKEMQDRLYGDSNSEGNDDDEV